ncbi:MAG: hypothetical protein IKI84_03310 [Clostridia bacterium]|nr:hypothetical protein [Clostridia bacterium]
MDDKPLEMTDVMFRFAAGGSLTLKEARTKLHEDAYLRPVTETLAKLCGMDPKDTDALKKRVTDLLAGSDPKSNRDSVGRKVRIWMSEKPQYISKKSAVNLLFALGMTAKDAGEALQRLCGESFHWRDPEDIVYLFALERGMSWAEVCALQERMAPLCAKAKSGDTGEMTENVRREASRLKTEEELEAFLSDAAPRLGVFHNTAYQLFMGFMDLLKSSETDDYLSDERKMTVSEILETYLYRNLIPKAKGGEGKKKGGAGVLKDAIQRDIQQNWPDEFTLARMTSREIDVNRKALILLFMACDGGESDYGDYYSDGSEDDVFEDSYARLSSMLSDCGFPPLDSRTPFDWMVLYCLAADDTVEIDENVARFLSAIFRGGDGEEDK